jgi:recombinational DNA repair protein (RecF pathway)
MEIVKSNGVVLSGAHSGESDSTARVFTGEHGKRNFIFKGLKKSRKRSMAGTYIITTTTGISTR